MRPYTAATQWIFDRVISRDSRRRTAVRVAALAAIPAIVTAAALHTTTVRSGDSLSALASKACGNSADWTGIYAQNQKTIGANPNLIMPGQKLTFKCNQAAIKYAMDASVMPQGGYSQPSTRTYGSASGSGATASTPYHGSSGMQACIISRESGGNSQVMNSTGHYGLYQFSSSTWAGSGGNPADFGHASVAEQNQVFANAVAARGYSDWTPYDGCGS
jgi:Transglycosylase-like domain/LysM domain